MKDSEPNSIRHPPLQFAHQFLHDWNFDFVRVVPKYLNSAALSKDSGLYVVILPCILFLRCKQTLYLVFSALSSPFSLLSIKLVFLFTFHQYININSINQKVMCNIQDIA
jgi:hypothetical protein